MTKIQKIFYSVFAAITLAFIFLLIGAKNSKPELSISGQQGPVTGSTEWLNANEAIKGFSDKLRSNPNDSKVKLQLAMAYVQEARATGNHGFYDDEALKLVEGVLKESPDNFDALCVKATVLLSQHHFSEALEIGKIVTEKFPHSSFGFGILTDAYVELGDYDKAIASADKMASLRPDIRSYSRISYLREIFGDYDGAIEAMTMAYRAGLPGTEQTEWARIYTGYLYELTGNQKMASELYNQSVRFKPDYAFAYAGLGRLEKQNKNYKAAESYFQKASATVNDFTFHSVMGDIYHSQAQPKKAEKEYYDAISMLTEHESHDGSSHGHYSDKELADLYLKVYRYDLALKHAMIEYNRRSKNVDVCHTLAWVHYRRGEYQKAEVLINESLKTKSKNPVMIFQAGLIKAKSGQTLEGKRLLKESLAMNSVITGDLHWEAEKFIDSNWLVDNSHKEMK